MIGWTQIVEASQEDARKELLQFLDDQGYSATSWQQGSMGLFFVELGAYLVVKGSRIAASMKNFLINERSFGEALTRFSFSHYQNLRDDAVATQRRVVLRCSSDEGPHTIDVGQWRASNAAGFEFSNIVDPAGLLPTSYPVVLPSGGTVTLLLQADIPGEGANTEDGGVSTIITTLAGVTISSDTSYRIGANDEPDNDLQTRNALKWSLLTQFGLIDDAVAAIALGASKATSRVIVDSNNPNGPGTFDVYLTGVEGEVGSQDIANVSAALTPYLMRPDFLRVFNSPLAPLNIDGDVYVTSEFNWETVVLPQILLDLETWRRTIPSGGFPYPSPGNKVPINEIENVIREVKIGEKKPVKTVKLSTPSGDLSVANFAHVTAGTWTLTRQVVL